MLEAFACFFLLALPIFYPGGPNGVREYLSVTGMALLGAIAGIGYLYSAPLPAPSLPILLFGGYIVLSVFWSGNKEHSIFDGLMILSCLTAYYVAQHIDRETALFLCFAPAPGIAATMMWEEVKYRKLMAASHLLTDAERMMQESYKRPGGLFGNCNHAGVYLALNVLTGAWLAQNVTLWVLPFVLLTVLGIFYSRSRNAQAATLIGIASIFMFMKLWLVFIPVLAIGIIALARIKNKRLSDRNVIFAKAISLILEKPVFGWGLNTFRIEHSYRKPFVATHRVHNDFLEFWYDLGVIGLMLIGFIYWSADWSFSPLLSAQLLIGAGTALWFFTFREIHTAMPVFGLLGALTPPVTASPYAPMIILLLLIAVPRLLWENIGKRVVGLYWYVKASHRKTKEDQYALCAKAIEYDRNSEYLTRCSYLAAKNGEINMAWDLCCRALYRFDGVITLYSLYAQTAKAALIKGAYGLADIYNRISLDLNPAFPASIAFRGELDRIQANLEKRRSQNGTVELH